MRSWLLGLAIGLALADSSVVTLALPDVLGDFDVGITTVAWVLTSYNLVLALPGALLVICVQDDLVPREWRLGRALAGATLCVASFLLFVMNVGSAYVSPSSYALLILPVLAGTLAVASLRSEVTGLS